MLDFNSLDMTFEPKGKRLRIGLNSKNSKNQIIEVDPVKSGEPGKGVVNSQNLAFAAPLTKMAFSPTGQLAAGSDGKKEYAVWKLGKLRADSLIPISVIPLDRGWVRDLVFSSDDKVLAMSAKGAGIAVCDPTANDPAGIRWLMSFNDNFQDVAALAVSSKGDLVAAALKQFSPDQNIVEYAVVVWKLATSEVFRWPMPGIVQHIAFAPDDRHLALGNGNGTVYILRLSKTEKGSGVN